MQNTTSINMEKIPCGLFQGHEQQKNAILGLGPDAICYKQPKAFRIKTFMIAALFVIGLFICSFFASVFYLKFGHKHKVVHYRALCAVPNYDDYNETIPYFLIQTDDLDSSWRTFIAPQIFEDLMDDFPYGYFFREEIEFNVTDGVRIHAAINILDYRNSFSSRFVHDFYKNQSAIVDFNNNRCFLMTLDHNITMNAQELLLSMQRMENIYPIPHGGQLQIAKRLILPAITDLSNIDEQIERDCHDKYVYKLDEFVTGDSKPIDQLITEDARFYEFFGRGITEYSIVNLSEVFLYEKQMQTSENSKNI